VNLKKVKGRKDHKDSNKLFPKVLHAPCRGGGTDSEVLSLLRYNAVSTGKRFFTSQRHLLPPLSWSKFFKKN